MKNMIIPFRRCSSPASSFAIRCQPNTVHKNMKKAHAEHKLKNENQIEKENNHNESNHITAVDKRRAHLAFV